MEHRFSLEKYTSSKSRHICPNCEVITKTFVYYIDNETGEYLANNVGRCNRESKCGYHFTPKQFFSDNGALEEFDHLVASYTPPIPKPISFIDFKFVLESMTSYKNNHFVQFLNRNYNHTSVKKVLEKYCVGTSDKYGGAVIFWLIDAQNRVRNGKVMVYDPYTGKRSKKQFTSAPKLLSLNDFNSESCFFGEHLLSNNNKPIAIVESEKTAIIASLYFDKYIWLASSGKSNLTPRKCKILNNRRVFLFPDSDGYNLWESKAKQFGFCIWDDLKDKEAGYDLADCIIEKINNRK